ncbi:MAG: RNA polymerase sigma-70 factor [Actinomycetes bacterium]
MRPMRMSPASRMLGRGGAASDVVQEAYLRHHRALAEGTRIDSTRAWLSAVTTRLAIDHLRSARVRRESYVGQWLPEPLLTDESDDPAGHVEQADSLSMAFLLVLERLSPVERAVFLLHDVFGYGYDEVSRIVGKSEANSRQLATRARKHLDERRRRFDASREEQQELAERFFAAVGDGDVDQLVDLLAADVVVHGDGGGKAPQWTVPIMGVDKVSRLFAALGSQMREMGIRVQLREINGQQGAIVLAPDDRITNVFVLDVADGVVQTIRSVINPDKLRHLGPVADVRELVLEHRKRAGPQ